MARSIHTIPPGQIMVITPSAPTQVYWPGTAAGAFLTSATSFGPYFRARETYVDGTATVSFTPFDPASYRGTFVANGITAVTVNNANILATDVIAISLNTAGGTVGASPPRVDTITPGSGFTTKALALDTSIYNYAIIRNAI